MIDTIPQVSSPRYTGPLRDIPQTISIIPRAVIEQQGALPCAMCFATFLA
ncbi:MAG: hypothetical protein WDO18_14835 [Acidobacteriota bacterium]